MASYKDIAAAHERRWQELRNYLTHAAEIADIMVDDRINYDKNTILQVIFKMDAMELPSEGDE